MRCDLCDRKLAENGTIVKNSKGTHVATCYYKKCNKCGANTCGSNDLCNRYTDYEDEEADETICAKCYISKDKYFAKELRNVYFNSGAGDDTKSLITKLKIENADLLARIKALERNMQTKIDCTQN